MFKDGKAATKAEESAPEQTPAPEAQPGTTTTGPATVPTVNPDEGAPEETTEDPASAVAPTNVAGAKTTLETPKVGAPLTLSKERRQLMGMLTGWIELSRKVRTAVRDLVNAEAESMNWDERRHLYNLSRTTAACEDIGDEAKLIAEGKLTPAPTDQD